MDGFFIAPAGVLLLPGVGAGDTAGETLLDAAAAAAVGIGERSSVARQAGKPGAIGKECAEEGAGEQPGPPPDVCSYGKREGP